MHDIDKIVTELASQTKESMIEEFQTFVEEKDKEEDEEIKLELYLVDNELVSEEQI